MKREKKGRFLKFKTKLENFQKNATKKQIQAITIISEIVYLCFIGKIIYDIRLSKSEELPGIILMAMFSSIAVIILIEEGLFKINKKEREERDKKMIAEVSEKFHLKTNEFKEIVFCPKDTEEDSTMFDIIQTLMELDVKFYAKLTEKSIVIIKKDKNGEVIGKPIEIADFEKFDNNYKPKE